ncbi:hypothetical protein SETIT_3G283200v2 [Setaria italica]|uniref:Uncharacterized protein n=1 Tax=Setaria italica TaxID=4555 RepID=A0A368QJT8_SETIT|nr:hypothetical protein SETIT_3G283200v2 [Setaria italica]
MSQQLGPCIDMAASATPSAALVLLVTLFLAMVAALASAVNERWSFWPGEELRLPWWYRRVQALLRQLNKPAFRTIQSPNDDLIDCVAAHLQLAFDNLRLC